MKPLSILIAIVIPIQLFIQLTDAQQRRRGARVPLPEQEKRALAEGFTGLTTDGTVVPGHFELRATGVSTEPVRRAAQAFLDGLSEAQGKTALFKVDDDEWRKWANQHRYPRQGVSFAKTCYVSTTRTTT